MVPVRRTLLRRITVWVLFIGLWWGASITVDSSFFPTPLQVVAAILSTVRSDLFLPSLLTTTIRLITAMIIVLIVSTGIMIAAEMNAYIRVIKNDIVFTLTYTMPPILWVFIALVLLGLSPATQIVIIIIVTLPHFIIVIDEGVTELDRDLQEVGAVFGTSRVAVFRHVTLPSLYPYLISGLRSLLSAGWKVAILAEVFTATTGIGYRIQEAMSLYDAATIMAWGVIILIIMVSTDRIIYLTDRVMLRKHLYAED